METVPQFYEEPPAWYYAEPIGACLVCGNELYEGRVCDHGDCHPECCEVK